MSFKFCIKNKNSGNTHGGTSIAQKIETSAQNIFKTTVKLFFLIGNNILLINAMQWTKRRVKTYKEHVLCKSVATLYIQQWNSNWKNPMQETNQIYIYIHISNKQCCQLTHQTLSILKNSKVWQFCSLHYVHIKHKKD